MSLLVDIRLRCPACGHRWGWLMTGKQAAKLAEAPRESRCARCFYRAWQEAFCTANGLVYLGDTEAVIQMTELHGRVWLANRFDGDLAGIHIREVVDQWTRVMHDSLLDGRSQKRMVWGGRLDATGRLDLIVGLPRAPIEAESGQLDMFPLFESRAAVERWTVRDLDAELAKVPPFQALEHWHRPEMQAHMAGLRERLDALKKQIH